MTSEDEPTARQAAVGGRISQFLHRVTAIMTWISVLLVPFLLVLGELKWEWWLLLIEILVVLILVPLGFAIWDDAGQEKVDTKRLRESGRQAVAEVVAVELIDNHDDDVETAVLSLRISGDGVPLFEATYRCPKERRFQVGARFIAIVDPSDNLFTLKQL